jgi:vacuolar-type H+-ATPase subunit E/Vma4
MDEHEQTLEQEILTDARRRADRALNRAQRQAEQLKATAHKAADKERDGIIDAAEAEADRREKVHDARIAQEIVAMQHRAVEDGIEAARALARRQLTSLAGSEGSLESLVRLAVLAIDSMKGEQFRLTVSAADAGRWGGQLAEQVRAAVADELGREVSIDVADGDPDCTGGLVVTGSAGREVADQTFQARLDRLWSDVREDVAKMLAGTWEAQK